MSANAITIPAGTTTTIPKGTLSAYGWPISGNWEILSVGPNGLATIKNVASGERTLIHSSLI